MRLDVVYATDENYAMYTGVSICSLLINNKNIGELVIHIIDNNVTSESKKKLTKLADEFNRRIVFHNSKKMFDNLASKITMKNTQTITAYACCFMAYLFDSSLDKVLYMDGDSLVCGSLSGLCDIDMSDYYVCGVQDIAAPIVREKIGFKQDDYYINSGFLYMSLENIRNANLYSDIIKFIEDVIPTSMHNDQDVVNGIYHSNTKVLPLKYNVLTPLYEKSYNDIKNYYQLQCYYDDIEVVEALKNPVFIHFTGSFTRRPWIKGCKHPKKEDWNYYKSLTEWKDVSDKPDNRTIKKKILDWMFHNLNVSVFKKLTSFSAKIQGKK